MLSRIRPSTMIAVKKIMYLVVFFMALMPYYGYQIAIDTGYYNFFAWWGMIVTFVIFPILDHILGQDPANPTDEQVKSMSDEWWYPLMTILVVPLQAGIIIYGAYIFLTTEHFNLIGYVGWVLSVGITSATLAINVGHELIHKDSKLETWAGGFLLATVFYAGFKVEHLRGHHVNVSTPEDASSARYGQSLYQFLPHAYLHNFINAWKLEAKRLRQKGFNTVSYHNELIWWYSLSVLFLLGFTVYGGLMGAIYYIGVCWMSFTTLEVINYVEHYGLHRRLLPNGKYERTTPAHSWNSNYLLTNMTLFHLQRHSDHHAFPKRRYQVLRHYDESPQLPSGYAGMYVIALIPALWFKIMNPRVEAYYKGEEWQLTGSQFEAAAKTHTVS